jgi:hypothetical protein
LVFKKSSENIIFAAKEMYKMNKICNLYSLVAEKIMFSEDFLKTNPIKWDLK